MTPLFSSDAVSKVIHYAAFERSVLGRLGFELNGVVDTHELAQRRSEKGEQNRLRDLCLRYLGRDLDKHSQTSDWSQRPLTSEQLDYAALDAEVLLDLLGHFER